MLCKLGEGVNSQRSVLTSHGSVLQLERLALLISKLKAQPVKPNNCVLRFSGLLVSALYSRPFCTNLQFSELNN